MLAASSAAARGDVANDAAAKLPANLPTAATAVTAKGVRKKRKREFKGNFKLFERWIRLKKNILLKDRAKKNGKKPGNVLFKIFFW